MTVQIPATDNQSMDVETSRQPSPGTKNLTSETASNSSDATEVVSCGRPHTPCTNGGTPNDRAKRYQDIPPGTESPYAHPLSDLSCLNPNDPELAVRSHTSKADVLDAFSDNLGDLPFPEEVLLPVPPDGGWGWVIVIASFFCCAVVDGLCSVFGVLLPDLVIYFEESASKVSLAGSVLAGGFLLSGPVASVVINCLGCRWATIIGAVLSATSLMTCIYSTSVLMFILLFGALGGLGIGLIYLPASVMVGYYFERRRGLAAGISSAGAGFGMLVLSLLAAFLVKQFGWKGCLMTMAGVSLQCLVCGALMRPLLPTLSVLRPEAFHVGAGKEKAAAAVAKPELVQPKFSPNLEAIRENVPLVPGGDTLKPSELSAETSDAMRNSAETTKPVVSLVDERQAYVLSRRLAGVGSCVELDTKRGSGDTAKRSRVSQERRQSRRGDYHSCQELSYGKTTGSLLGLLVARTASVKLDPVVTPMMKKDVLYGGSFASLQDSISRANKDAGSYSDMYHPAAFEPRPIVSQAVHMLKETMDLSVLFNASFLVICLASVLIQLAYFVPIVFLPAYGLSIGLSPEQAAMLLAVAGLSTVFGRSTAGALASTRCVNGLHLNCLSLIVAGVATNFVFLCTSFKLLVMYGVVFGISVSGFVPMTTVFLVKYIGLEKLTSSFGLLSMIKGIATMAGPPIAGALLDSTKSYNSSFLFSGCLFIASGLLFYVLPFTQKHVSLRHEYAPFYCPAKRDVETKDFDDDFFVGNALQQT